MTTDDMSDGTWTFYDSEAAFPGNHAARGGFGGRNVVGEFIVSLRAPDGDTYGEFAIRFHDHGDRWTERIAARLEAFGDSWKALASGGLVQALASIDGEVQDQEAVRALLLGLGYEDITSKLRGDRPAHCPTCHGKGVLDDVASSVHLTTP